MLGHARTCIFHPAFLYIYCVRPGFYFSRVPKLVFLNWPHARSPFFHGVFIYLSQGLGDWSLNINMCWGILASWPRPDRFGSSLSSYITLMPFHIIFPVTVCYIFSFGPGPPCILHSEKHIEKQNISHALEGAAL